MFHSQTSRPFRCHPACVHQEDCKPSLASHLALKTCSQVTVDFHSQVDSPLKTCLQMHHRLLLSSQSSLKTCSQVSVHFYSQVSHLSRRVCKCTVDFHSQVTSPLKIMLASALLTFTPCQVASQDVLASAPLTFTHNSLRCCHCHIRDRLATVAHLSFCGAVILLV